MPDPTVLTTEQLLREVDRARQLVDSEMRGMRAVVEEKFTSIDDKFRSVEAMRVEQKRDTQDAVDAAFSAAKEAVREQTTASDRAIAKSENSMFEQLRQLKSTFDTAFDGVRRDIDDLKERIGGAEQQKVGSQEATASTGAIVGFVIGAAGVITAIVAVAAQL